MHLIMLSLKGLQYEQDEYGAVSEYGKYGPEQRVEKFIGVDATSDGRTSGPNYRTNLLRYATQTNSGSHFGSRFCIVKKLSYEIYVSTY